MSNTCLVACAGLGGPGIFGTNGFDPQLTFCGLTTVGDKLNFGYYGIPFARDDRPSVNDTIIRAMNVFVSQAINSGAYLAASKTYFPDPPSRPQCTYEYEKVLESQRSSPVLDILDMAGLYVVQAAGAALAVIVYGIRVARARARARAAHVSSAAAAEAAGPEEDGTLKQPAHAYAVTRRFVRPTGEVTTLTLASSGRVSLHGSAVPHQTTAAVSPRRRDAAAALPSFADHDIDGGAWGQRTGMERRLTNMIQELSMQIEGLRTTVEEVAPPAK